MRPPALVTKLALAVLISFGALSQLWLIGGTEARSALPAVVRNVWVPQAPEFLTVDQRTDRVFVISARNVLSTLDARTGKVVHTARSGDRPGRAATDERTGRVFVPNIGHTVQVLDARNGVVLRTVTLPGNPGDVVVAERSGHVFVGNLGHDPIAMLDARTGDIVRLITAGKDPGIVTIDHHTGRVFAATWDHHRVAVLETGTGNLLRMVNAGRKPIQIAADERTDRIFETSAYAPPGPSFRPVYLLHMLDGRDGHVLAAVHLQDMPAGLAIAPRLGRVLLPEVTLRNEQGRIELFDAQSGSHLQTVTIPGGPVGGLAVDEAHGRLFVTSNVVGSSSLRVLDLRTLKVLETLHVGVDTAAMAIDQRTNRLFLANLRNSVTVVDLGS